LGVYMRCTLNIMSYQAYNSQIKVRSNWNFSEKLKIVNLINDRNFWLY